MLNKTQWLVDLTQFQSATQTDIVPLLHSESCDAGANFLPESMEIGAQFI